MRLITATTPEEIATFKRYEAGEIDLRVLLSLSAFVDITVSSISYIPRFYEGFLPVLRLDEKTLAYIKGRDYSLMDFVLFDNRRLFPLESMPGSYFKTEEEVIEMINMAGSE